MNSERMKTMRFLQLGRHARNTDYSVGIIGGADGPTSIFISDGAWLWLRRLLEKTAVLAAAVAALGGVILLIRKRMK